MHRLSYVLNLLRSSPKPAALLAFTLFVSGCSSLDQPAMTVAFNGANNAASSTGLAELLRRNEGKTLEAQVIDLMAFDDSGADKISKHKGNYVLARLLQQKGEAQTLQEAVTRYKDAALFAPLFVRSQMHAAECAAALGDEKAVLGALNAIVGADSKTVDAKSRASAFYGLGQSALRSDEKNEARECFQQAQKADPQSQFALGSLYYLAWMDLHPDSSATTGGVNAATVSSAAPGSAHPNIAPAVQAAAFDKYRRYLTASPDGRFVDEILRDLQSNPAFVATPQDHDVFAKAYFAHGHWQAALDQWQKVGSTSDWFHQAQAMMSTGKSAQAKQFLLEMIKTHPEDESVDNAATLIARQSDKEGAVAAWTAVAQNSTKFADEGLYNLGTRAATHEDSLAYYKQILAKYPTSAFAPESAWWLVWEDLKNGRYAQAVPQLETDATRYATHRNGPRFEYWLGKAHEKLGHKDLAKGAYQKTIAMQPWNYYSYRAKQRIAALNGGKDEGWTTVPTRHVAWAEDTAQQWQWPEPPKTLAAQEGVGFETLTELRQWDECLEMLPKNRKGILRAFYLAKLNRPMEAINSAVPTLNGTPSRTEAWELSYPLLHAKQIAKEAPKKQVDPFLVQGLIREESRYNAGAKSSSNALGLMQLLPGTAYGVAKRLGIKLNGIPDVHVPNTNITLGTDYLGYVHGRFNGNALFAVASYNGGPNAVARWAKTMPADTDVFVENIPFKETRDYVRKVFGSYWNYRAIYGSNISG